jgi:hypothetical protein
MRVVIDTNVSFKPFEINLILEIFAKQNGAFFSLLHFLSYALFPAISIPYVRPNFIPLSLIASAMLFLGC